MAQIGSIKLQTGSGTVTLPVFELADLDVDALRVQTASGVGGIPLLAVNEATFNYLRIQGSSLFGLHDAATAGPRSAGVIDDFEDNDLSEYADPAFHSQGDFQIDTTTVFEGTYSLLHPYLSPGSNTSYDIASTSGLPSYPQAGDSFEFRTRLDGNPEDVTQTIFYYGYGDSGNDYYSVNYRPGGNTGGSGNNTFFFNKRSGGSLTEPAGSQATLVDNEWVRIEVDWGEGGQHTARIYDSSNNLLDTISYTDSEFSSGGVGFHHRQADGENTDARWDIAEITETTASTGVIDDFEDGNVSEYLFSDAGPGARFETTQTQVYEGTYALLVEGEDGGNGARGESTSGLPRYPQAGDTFSYRIYRTSNSFDNFYFAYTDGSNNYSATTDDGRIRLIERVGGSFNEFVSVNATIPTGEWLEIEIDWGSNGTIGVEVFDSLGSSIVSGSGTSTAYTGGGIAFGQVDEGDQGGQTIYFDIAEITESGDKSATGVVDGFEDGDMAEYSNNGDTTPVIDSTGFVTEGSQSFKLTDTQGSPFQEFLSTSGLDRYPSAGDTFAYDIEFTSVEGNLFWDIYFGVQDSSNYYRLVLTGDMVLQVFSGGSSTELARTSNTYSEGDRNTIEIEWQADGTINVDKYNLSDYPNGTPLQSLSGNDASYTDGGIAIAGGGDNTPTATYDNIRIL